MRERFTVIFLLLFMSSLSADAQTKRKIVTRGIVNGAARILPKPDYPQSAKDLCAEGKVEVEIVGYLATGEVLEAKAISGDELLREAAEIAARQAKFTVPLINGDTNINFQGILVYNFVPERKCFVKGVVNDKAVQLPKPEFPPNSCYRCGGSISVRIVIDEIGNVLRAKAISGHPLLRVAAEKAARQAKFQPTNDVGKIRVKAILIYYFGLVKR